MNHALLDLVRCPKCRGGNLEVAGDPSWQLICPNCGAAAPIVAGIPRMADQTESYAASFGRQWNRYDVARDQEDESTFKTKTGVMPRDLAGKLVLDAGCGGGRYARLAGSHGARVIAVDLSSAVAKAAELCVSLPNVLVLQADLLYLPIALEAFDVVYSIGVLHNPPNSRRTFHAIAVELTGRPSAVWLHRRNRPLGMAQQRTAHNPHARPIARAPLRWLAAS
jgi:SAM-dependent methyltransferase